MTEDDFSSSQVHIRTMLIFVDIIAADSLASTTTNSMCSAMTALQSRRALHQLERGVCRLPSRFCPGNIGGLREQGSHWTLLYMRLIQRQLRVLG